VGKSYTAYAGGTFTAKSGEYHDHLIKDKVKSSVSIVRSGRNALPVHTRWRIIEAVDEKLTKVELEPVTGRTHQLRAHMAHYGHPLLGDDKYGDRELNKAYRSKLCLWCRMVEINGVEFTAEAPDWLER
jgi:23S rRNA pseudouridine955/2504/2580 synthase